jgi:hypothetical protein
MVKTGSAMNRSTEDGLITDAAMSVFTKRLRRVVLNRRQGQRN